MNNDELKATYFGIKRFANNDGKGLRTTLFFSGCPLRCLWCHNPEGFFTRPKLAHYESKCINCLECLKVCKNNAITIVDEKVIYNSDKCANCGKCVSICYKNANIMYGEEITLEEAYKLVTEDKAFYGKDGGVTFSGGECLLQIDFVYALASRLYNEGISVDIDTCGYIPEDYLTKILPYVDTFLYDIKAIDSDLHKTCTGKDNSLILSNLKYLVKMNKNIEVRIPYIPEYNSQEMSKIGDYLLKLNIKNIKVLPFHNFSKNKYSSLNMECKLSEKLPSKEEMDEVVSMFISKGFNANK